MKTENSQPTYKEWYVSQEFSNVNRTWSEQNEMMYEEVLYDKRKRLEMILRIISTCCFIFFYFNNADDFFGYVKGTLIYGLISLGTMAFLWAIIYVITPRLVYCFYHQFRKIDYTESELIAVKKRIKDAKRDSFIMPIIIGITLVIVFNIV